MIGHIAHARINLKDIFPLGIGQMKYKKSLMIQGTQQLGIFNWLSTQIELITVLFEMKRFDDGYVKYSSIKRPFITDTIE